VSRNNPFLGPASGSPHSLRGLALGFLCSLQKGDTSRKGSFSKPDRYRKDSIPLTIIRYYCKLSVPLMNPSGNGHSRPFTWCGTPYRRGRSHCLREI
jgi:hypothetical protein